MTHILVLNGPNLNLLGTREVEQYGTDSLEVIQNKMTLLAEELTLAVSFFQSNSESELIEHIHHSKENGIDFIIFNPAAFTHTSIALRDALTGVNQPFIEVHLSNTANRESFRKLSYFADIAIGSIIGLGSEGYLLALRFAQHYLKTDCHSKKHLLSLRYTNQFHPTDHSEK